ncbi:hypothetical protein E1301_Tti005274 [Triplophysa tibetana]|uniref:HECT domain-containing protein n=1 Tax=Triplophysa tibetana TaxID=1572043 RepID=A0A5A9PMY1_9TELE|nr:hypothetical protein E1301_Tti005274 [Triplophysa tibetana]
MSERELAKYIPCYGDRVAVVAFCRKTQDSISNRDRKSNLFERLRKRVCTTSTKEEHRQHISKRYAGNSNAKKKSKRVELGWMNFSARENDFKQVRSAKGGGTRHVSMDVKSTVRDVQKLAERLFFPNGKSKHLELTSLDCSIRDFSHRMVESEFTIEDLYEETKVKILRLYLFTKSNDIESTAENSDINPEADVMFTEGAQDDGQSSSSSGIKESETIDLTTLEESEETSFMLHSPLYIMGEQISVMQTETVFDYMETENRDDIMQEQMGALIQETSENVNTVQEVWSPEAFNTNSPAQKLRIATDVEESPFEDSFDNVVTIGGGLSDVGNFEDTIPLEDPPKTIILKLANILQEQKPTPKRVREILVFPEVMTAQQSFVSRFLKKYIMELDDTTLKNFLRFCTGADLLTGNRITVNFIETSDFQCRPQAHTCGCYLMLPLNYQNYPDLRSDFNAVLNSSVWVMDIV